MLTGHVGPYIPAKASASGRRLVRRHLEQRAARRRVAHGFPVDARPFTKAEVEEYFSGDRITCLLCGRSLKRLANHLPQIHAMTEDDYRKMYGLPWSRGLTSAADHQNSRAAMLKRIEKNGGMWLDPNQPAGWAAPRRAAPPFKREVDLDNGYKTVYTEGDIERAVSTLMNGIDAGRRVRDMLGRDGVPNRTTLNCWFRRRPELRGRVLGAIWAKPAAYQATSGYGLGPGVWEDIKRLRGQGLSDHKIAALLGVTAMPINKGRRARGIA